MTALSLVPQPRQQVTDRPADDLHLMVLLFQQERTRDVALEMADRNRKEAALGKR